MKTADIKVLMENIAPVLKDYVGQSIAPLSTRLDAIDRRFAEMPAVRDGKDADTDATANIVFLRLKPEIDEVRSCLDAIAPKFGAIISDVDEHVARALAAAPKPKDGVGVAGAIIDRDGNLVLTTTDGAQKDLGKVVGKDGADAEVQDVDTAPDDVAALVSRAIRLMAESPEIVSGETEKGFGGGVNIHLPNVVVPDVVIPEIKLPEIKMPPVHVNVEQPKKRRTRTVVTEHDTRGRVKKFEQEEID